MHRTKSWYHGDSHPNSRAPSYPNPRDGETVRRDRETVRPGAVAQPLLILVFSMVSLMYSCLDASQPADWVGCKDEAQSRKKRVKERIRWVQRPNCVVCGSKLTLMIDQAHHAVTVPIETYPGRATASDRMEGFHTWLVLCTQLKFLTRDSLDPFPRIATSVIPLSIWPCKQPRLGNECFVLALIY
ncbi:uncharacterized protein BCR38DRAFT_417324 [Pseudomassariella vexata]|uniref:Uncharacterized protein n=1 Tax=Pseudomassariella vexata TaxID=1141098 RepID=A0A1Y2EIX9_9PEZI|nr:uncharacterized protein BCR38DRAFT_417324 [Pseudomassariella vexata]ORY71542.1 hypothetical protein BCR38DRAFT_417324 [Pseudomassariella vexata]